MIGDPLLGSPRDRPGPGAPPARDPRSARDPRPAREPRPAPRPTSRPPARRGPAAEPAPVPSSGAGKDFRPDIEGLRALAVGAVLLYHAHLGPFEGGYIGVDVFFVLSGFLITRLLVNEVGRTGTVSLPSFWARRARRLLPASTLVLVATLVASRLMLDPLTQGFVNRSGLAASAFGANILFWTRGGYSQLTLPEPLLHYWSLAVEEQFYLFWPVILLGVSRLRGHFRRLAATLAVVVGVASFLLCVAVTPSRQPFAFYWLPTRAWELLIGAGIAFAGVSVNRLNVRFRALGAWAGLAVIVFCAITYDDPALGFPGARAALPVLATALVVIGAPALSGPATVLSWAPLQWIGKHSYAIYLWHFPFLVLPAAKWGPLETWERVALLAASIAVSAVSFRLLEDPVRGNKWLAARPWRSLRLGAGLAAAGLFTGVVLLAAAPSLEGGAATEAPTIIADSTPDTTLDPAATTAAPVGTDAPDTTSPSDDGQPYPANPAALVRLAEANADLMASAVANDEVPSNLEPSLKKVYDDKPRVYDDGCILPDNKTEPDPCVYGATGSSTTVVLYGDSHAAQWFPAFEQVAKKRGWKLVVMTKMACPAGDIRQESAAQTKECRTWRANVLERLQELKPDLLVMASFRYVGTTAGQWQTALDGTMADFRPTATKVLILGDTPTPTGDVPSCVAANLSRVSKCNAPRSKAVRPNWLGADAKVAAAHDATLITTGDWLCGTDECPVIVGNVLLYRDESHLTTAGAKLMAPYVEASLRAVLNA